jgi:hypothetical protein
MHVDENNSIDEKKQNDMTGLLKQGQINCHPRVHGEFGSFWLEGALVKPALERKPFVYGFHSKKSGALP